MKNPIGIQTKSLSGKGGKQTTQGLLPQGSSIESVENHCPGNLFLKCVCMCVCVSSLMRGAHQNLRKVRCYMYCKTHIPKEPLFSVFSYDIYF
jgi:hypothetical protein